MSPVTYPAVIERTAENSFFVRFPDIPEALTEGETFEQAHLNAGDALTAAIEGLISVERELPTPRLAGVGEINIPLEPPIAARVLLRQAMAQRRLSKVALADLMHRDEKAVRRILSGKGASLDLTLEALRALGVRAGLAA